MNRRIAVKVLLASLAAGALALPACTSGEYSNTYGTTSTASPGSKTDQPPAQARGAWPTQHTGESMTWTAMAFPTGEARTSVVGVEKGVPAQVRSGTQFGYDIVVTNLSSAHVRDVVVTDQVSNFKFVKSTPEGKTDSGGVSFALGEFKPGETKVVHVTGAPSNEGQMNSCAAVSYESSLCSVIPVVSPKLTLVKTAPAEVSRCDDLAYNFEVSNSGTGIINDVKITDRLPEGLKTTEGKNTIEIAAGTLAAGQSKQFTTRVRADKTGTYENQATASGDGLEADSSMVSVVVRQPALTVDIECPQNTLIGREATFKYTVKSTGDIASANTVLNATLPPGATFVRADNNGTHSGDRVSWNLGTLKPEETRTVTLTARAGSAGNLQASASVLGACAAAVTDSCNFTIEGVPDIGISLKDDTGVAVVGENHVFTYTVKNQGQIDLTNVVLNATLSAGLDFVASTAPTQAKVNGKSASWNLGTLKPGQEMTFTITAKGTAAGEQGIDTVTKSDQLQRTSDASEQVNFVTH